jgi:2-methylcitrate dehydratase PrpD
LSARYPGSAGNIVSVRLRDGRQVAERVDDPPGHARAPLSDGELEAKFRAVAEPRLGAARAAVLLRKVWSLDSMDSARDLLPLAEITP